MMAERMNDTGALSTRHHLHSHQLPPRAGDLFTVHVIDGGDVRPSAGAGDGDLPSPTHRSQPPEGGGGGPREANHHHRPAGLSTTTNSVAPETTTMTTTNANAPRGGGGPPRLGRRGDPRMHRAVAARLANPKMSLLEALRAGGFDISPGQDNDANGPAGKGKDGGGGMCGDGVTLSQRKNQLSRRLRLVRQRDAAAAGKKGQRFVGGASRRMSGMSGSEWETDGDGSCCEDGCGSGRSSRRNSLFSVNLPPVTGIPMSSPELAAAQAAAVEAIKTRAANSRQKRRLSQLKEEQEQRERQQAAAGATSNSASSATGATANTPAAANNIAAANDNGLVSLSESLRRERELLLMRERQKQQQQEQAQEQSRGGGHKIRRISGGGTSTAGSAPKTGKNTPESVSAAATVLRRDGMHTMTRLPDDHHLKGVMGSGGTAPPPLLLGGSAAGARALGLGEGLVGVGGGDGRVLQDGNLGVSGECGSGAGGFRDGGHYSSLLAGQQVGATAGSGASSFLPSPTAANNAIAASASSSNIWNNNPTTAATAAAMGLVDPSLGHGHRNDNSDATTVAAAGGGGTSGASLTPHHSVYLELLRHQQEQLKVQQLIQAHYGGKAMTTPATEQQLNFPLSAAQALSGGREYQPNGMMSSPSGSAAGPTGSAGQIGPGTDPGALTWRAGMPLHSSNMSLPADAGTATAADHQPQHMTTTAQIASMMQQAQQAAAAAQMQAALAQQQQQLGASSGTTNNDVAGGPNGANSYATPHANADCGSSVGAFPPSSLPLPPQQPDAASAAAMFAMNGVNGVGCSTALAAGTGTGTGTGTEANHHTNFANLGGAEGGLVLPNMAGVDAGGILPPSGGAQLPSANGGSTAATRQTRYC